jgi:predicted lipoprotein with Yx(FWY)xxD motif
VIGSFAPAVPTSSLPLSRDTTLTRDNASRRGRRPLVVAVLAAVASLGLAACGGGQSESSTAGGATPASSAASATVKASKLPGYNSVLTTSSGQALYMLTADPRGGSRCSGSCASQWPPLLKKGAVQAGPGVTGSLLSAFKRSDGTEQVMYNHHALYTHAGQGVTSGAGMASDGGIWYLVSPSGKAVKSTSSGGY